jgi:hypothetical protein
MQFRHGGSRESAAARVTSAVRRLDEAQAERHRVSTQAQAQQRDSDRYHEPTEANESYAANAP